MIDCAVIVTKDIYGILIKKLDDVWYNWPIILDSFTVVRTCIESYRKFFQAHMHNGHPTRPSFAPFLPIGVTSMTLLLIFELEVAILRTCSCITSCTIAHAKKSAHWS